jgi:biopolymer transport protein ExbB
MMNFDIVHSFLSIALYGAQWVLWLLVALSILSLAIIAERWYFFAATRLDFATFNTRLTAALSAGDLPKARELCQHSTSIEAKVALFGLSHSSRGYKAMEGSMEGFAIGERHKLDRGLVVLGTLGNNAPFIGLFGTVIGIIQAFHQLAQSPTGGPSLVMSGISEALVATAVGLLVAIPAVIAFNTFNRIVRRHMANVSSIIKVILVHQGST